RVLARRDAPPRRPSAGGAPPTRLVYLWGWAHPSGTGRLGAANPATPVSRLRPPTLAAWALLLRWLSLVPVPDCLGCSSECPLSLAVSRAPLACPLARVRLVRDA